MDEHTRNAEQAVAKEKRNRDAGDRNIILTKIDVKGQEVA